MNAKDLHLDYFLFYDLENAVDVRELITPFWLKGQFDEEAEKTKLAFLTMFGNPASKGNEEIYNKDAHLAWYKIYRSTDPLETWRVILENQFGKQEILIRGVRAVLVPAQKGIVLPGRTGFSKATKLDHYKVYRVLWSESVNKQKQFRDQFHRIDTGVYYPTGFAVPVTKEHQGKSFSIINEKAHLTIYKIKPSGDMRQVINVRDQFGTFRHLRIGVAYFLGVPSRKIKWEKVE